MVDPRLVDYAAQLLKKGYTASQIKQQLLSSGYDSNTINEVMHHAKGGKHLNVPLILGGVVFLIVLGGLVWFLLASFGGATTDITLNINPSSTSLVEGDTLTFTTRMQNTHDDPVSIRARHDILSTSELVQREQESLTIRGNYVGSTYVNLGPAVVPGEYTLRTTVEYEDAQKTSSFSFSVNPDETERPTEIEVTLDACPSDCDDFNACTIDSCEAGRCVNKPKESCCGDNICEGSENVLSCAQDCRERSESTSIRDIQEDALEAGAQNGQLGAQECAKIALDYEHDSCFNQLSTVSEDPIMCGPIFNVELRDSCYLQFALEDSSVCVNIVDAATQQTCLNYARYAALAATAEA